MKNNLLSRLNALKYEEGGSMVIIPKGITARIEEYANQKGKHYESAVMEIISSGITNTIDDAL